jgi:hypothetical protein
MSALITSSSRVRAVTVYRRGAMVTRIAELEREGDHFPDRLQLVGLPLTLDDGSVRVAVVAEEGQGAAPIAGDLRVTLSVPSLDPQLAPPSDEELEQAKLELAQISAELEQLVRAEGRLARLQPLGRGRPEEGKPPAPSPTAARLELLSFRRERAERLGEQIHAQRERERVAKEQLASLRERERLASSQRNARTDELRKAAILELDRCTGEGLAKRVRVELTYFVPGARWAPAYTIRLDRSMRSASLELRAMVGQATGEDWQGVALTLSTATPQQWTELPKLESRRIGRRQPPPAKTGWRPPPVGAGELYADYDRGLGGPREAVDEPSPIDDELDFDLADDRPMGSLELAKALERSLQPQPKPPPQMSMPAPPGFGGPPPPAGAPMPSGAPMPMPEEFMMPTSAPSRSRSSGVGALLDGAVEAAGAVAGVFARGGGGPQSTATLGMPPEPEPELLAGRELLDYGRLRLHSAADTRRGSLRRIDTRVLYQQLSVEALTIDVAIREIERAVGWARALEHEPAPEAHRWPSSEGGFDYAYVADAPSDLRSDGRFHSLVIDTREAEATPRYVAVPRETQDVFRIVALRNPLAAPLLPGPVDVYVAGKFALTSAVEITPIGGRLELGLGVEQAVKIARNVSFGEDSSGMFKRQLELRHTIAIEIANHLPSAATVEVRERLPTAWESQADDITVEVDEVEPSWEDYEPKSESSGPPLTGGRRWIVEVPANGKRELEARWTVKIPTNHELVGGNRREV